MIDEIGTKVVTVASQVFETMFFIPIEVQEGEDDGFHEPNKPCSAYLRGEVGFEGKGSGRLVFFIPVELAKMMASNFMGLDEAFASDSQTVDMVNELCNMICGNLFSQLDKKTVWNLTIPQTREVNGQVMDGGNGDRTVTVRFNAEGYPVQLQVQFVSVA